MYSPNTKPGGWIWNTTEYNDTMYETYKSDPDQLDESWKMFFKGFEYHFSFILLSFGVIF